MKPEPQKVTPFKLVFSKNIVAPAISMSGHLFTDNAGAILGWLVNSWTERGIMPPLRPKMHWVSAKDGKLRRAFLQLDYLAVQPLNEDAEIEPHRSAFIRATLGNWEREYLDGLRA